MGKKGKGAIRPTLVVLEGLYAAGEMAPFPYIKGIAGLAITILKMIDNASMNDKDIQELAERIGHTITSVNDAALIYLRTDNGDESIIKELCASFMRCLEDIIHNLEMMQSKNASKSRIMQYLTTANVRDEINGFVRQVENLQKNFDTNNIISIRASLGNSFRILEENMRELRAESSEMHRQVDGLQRNLDVRVEHSLRTLECNIRELREEHSDMHRTLTLLLATQNELRIQLSEQGRLLGAMDHVRKREGGEGTIIEMHYRFLETLTTMFFSMVSCFINLLRLSLSVASALYTRGAKICRRLSPSMSTSENVPMSIPNYGPGHPFFSIPSSSHPVQTRSGSKASDDPRRLHHNKYYHLYDGGGRHHNRSESRRPKRAYLVGRNNWYDVPFDPKAFAPTVRAYPPDGYPERTGRKRALCIGINYVSHRRYGRVDGEPSGCIKDAVKIGSFLSEHWSSSSRGAIEIKILRDDSRNADEIPTKSNIIKAMRWLVKDARPDDSLVFHYSGHGGQIRDQNGDEADGYDEVIFPADGDYIVDDDMHALMVKPLPPGCRLTALFDCCHSGSALDLPYVWHDFDGLFQGGSVTRKWIRRKSSRAGVISLSSSKDSRISMDTPQGGAMSDAFIMSLKHDAYPTYNRFFDSISKIMTGKYRQMPQLCCSSNVDTKRSFVL